MNKGVVIYFFTFAGVNITVLREENSLKDQEKMRENASIEKNNITSQKMSKYALLVWTIHDKDFSIPLQRTAMFPSQLNYKY